MAKFPEVKLLFLKSEHIHIRINSRVVVEQNHLLQKQKIRAKGYFNERDKKTKKAIDFLLWYCSASCTSIKLYPTPFYHAPTDQGSGLRHLYDYDGGKKYWPSTNRGQSDFIYR